MRHDTPLSAAADRQDVMPTTLETVVSSLDNYPGEAVIFAERRCRRFSPQSAALVLELEDSELGQPVNEVACRRAPRKDYFLEVDVAREALTVWSEWRDGQEPTLREAVRAVIHYAEHDAFEPTSAA